MDGDAHSWTWTTDGRRYTYDNPLILAERKAKRLKSLLMRQPSMARGRLPMPRVEALVFLSAREMRCRLSGLARTRTYLRGTPGADKDEGIVAAISGMTGTGMAPRRVDQPLGRAVARAMDEAGVRPSRAQRRVGDYELGKQLQDGEAWQDWEATHVGLPGIHRRIRVYPYAPSMAADERKALYRVAAREFEILEGLDHQGILRAREFTDSERGPALIFDHDPGARRLDLYLRERGETLGNDQRLGFLRQLGETLRYAHGRRVFHRALSPESILVRNPGSAEPRLVIFNWQTATRLPSTEGGRPGTGTLHPEAFVEQPSLVYLAPELLREPERTGPHLDVFSLGAIAYRLFANRPPAATAVELAERLADGKGLRISDVVDGAGGELQALIQESTAPAVSNRIETAEEFLAYLTYVEDELTSPDQRVVDPLEARRGDRLEGGFEVLDRLGKGSTAVALLVHRDGDEEDRVLKVALDRDLEPRLRREGEILRGLRHQNVVQLHEVLTVGGRAALLMARAGDRTLAQVLREQGRLSLDLLGRFGEDLLATVEALEHHGVAHRDIKPDNIGVAQLGQKGALRLVLFDFSLSGTPPEDIGAGTRPYLDPFLRQRKPPRWDLYAERFAAAMTLYEMATGTLPAWGDGRSDPSMVKDEVSLDLNRFDTLVRDGLAAFMRKALRREAAERFDNAEEMLRAWRQVFEPTRAPGLTVEALGAPTFAERARLATATTSVADLGFGAGALSVLEGMGINTVRDLLGTDRIRFRYLRNVSERVRKEIRLAAKELAHLRPDLVPGRMPTVHDEAAGEARASIDALSERLLPRKGLAEDTSEDRSLEILLGLDGLDEADDRPAGWRPWRGAAEAAHLAGQAQATLAGALVRARERWGRQPHLAGVRDDVERLLSSNGSVMTAEEVAQALLAARGSEEPDPRRRVLAGAVARAAAEAELASAELRFQPFLVQGQAFVADRLERAEYAAALGRAADGMAALDPLPTPHAALERLREVPLPSGIEAPTDRRLPILAAAASRTAALSSRSEIYPSGMPAGRALALASGSLLGPKVLSAKQIRDRVEGRYPRAEPLPPEPEALEALLRRAELDLSWDPVSQSFAFGGADTRASSTGRPLARLQTEPGTPERGGPEADAARALERRLLDTARDGGFLALVVGYRHVAEAERELLSDRFGADRVGLDALLIRAMREEAAALGADWGTVLRADAAPQGSLDRRRLLQLARRSLPAVERRLTASDRPLLLTDAGLLGRYGLIDLVDRLRDAAGRAGGPRAVWLLAPADGPVHAPMLEGVPVPIIAATQWTRVPKAWIENRHRGARPAEMA